MASMWHGKKGTGQASRVLACRVKQGLGQLSYGWDGSGEVG